MKYIQKLQENWKSNWNKFWITLSLFIISVNLIALFGDIITLNLYAIISDLILIVIMLCCLPSFTDLTLTVKIDLEQSKDNNNE